MKRIITILIACTLTLVIILGFYFFFPQVWGEAIYPLEYRDFIKKYAKEYNIRPNFLCAMIYTESRFHADSVSGAGAIGLMQVMPGTGASIAQELGESDYSPAKLRDPETNIRYGSWYIKGLLDKYNGDTDIAVAAYNAGSGRADAWKDGRGPLPYETVFYIQKVKNIEEEYNKVYDGWADEPTVVKPAPFYQGVNNIKDFVRGLILGK